VIADEDTVIGFSLAGFRALSLPPPKKADKLLIRLPKQRDGDSAHHGARAQMIRAKVDNWILSGRQPLIVELPDSRGPVEGRRTPTSSSNQPSASNLKECCAQQEVWYASRSAVDSHTQFWKRLNKRLKGCEFGEARGRTHSRWGQSRT